jgi:acetyl esterase/lipase
VCLGFLQVESKSPQLLVTCLNGVNKTMKGTCSMVNSTYSPQVIPLWPGGAPGSEHWSEPEQETYIPMPSAVPQTILPLPFEIKIARNIAKPRLLAYLPTPSVASGTAVIICPGGAFNFLSIELEGKDVARWLCARGIAAFVLKYRVAQTAARDEDFITQLEERFTKLMSLMELMQQTELLAIADGLQAIKVVRRRAAEWGVAPERIGIMGFSTGGVIAIGTAMQYDEESRPNFAAPIYPAFSGMAVTVPADAPPLFLLAASDDPMAVGTSLPLYSSWKDAGRPVELHLYAQGGHGFGMKKQGLPSDQWIDRFGDWLQLLRLLA